MITIPVASVIGAVVSLTAAIGAAAVAGYFTYWSDRRKRHAEVVASINKYRDPLLIAAVILHHRLARVLAEKNMAGGDEDGRGSPDGHANFYDHGVEKQDSYYVAHTAFLVGQFLAWLYILRLDAQFLNLQRADEGRSLEKVFYQIEKAWSNQDSRDFALWRGEQSAIGELMTITSKDGQHSCMGYAAFYIKWRNEEDFSRWFGNFRRLHQIWSMPDGQKRLKELIRRIIASVENVVKGMESYSWVHLACHDGDLEFSTTNTNLTSLFIAGLCSTHGLCIASHV
jgi:hypothetical protein